VLTRHRIDYECQRCGRSYPTVAWFDGKDWSVLLASSDLVAQGEEWKCPRRNCGGDLYPFIVEAAA
jgi:hypothetical protein